MSKKSSTFAPAFEKEQLSGAVVQLVRIPACHAVGREFESRPHRKNESFWVRFLFLVRRPNLANTNSLGRENSHDDVSELTHQEKARARRK